MAECLHLYFCLKAGFELKGKVVIVDRDIELVAFTMILVLPKIVKSLTRFLK